MSNAQKTAKKIKQFLDQYSDGYLLIAFNPTDGTPIVLIEFADGKTEVAINSLASGVISQGGVGPVRAQIKAQEQASQDPTTEDPELLN